MVLFKNSFLFLNNHFYFYSLAPPLLCDVSDCSNHGVCLGTKQNSGCICRPGYSGSRCELGRLFILHSFYTKIFILNSNEINVRQAQSEFKLAQFVTNRIAATKDCASAIKSHFFVSAPWGVLGTVASIQIHSKVND